MIDTLDDVNSTGSTCRTDAGAARVEVQQTTGRGLARARTRRTATLRRWIALSGHRGQQHRKTG